MTKLLFLSILLMTGFVYADQSTLINVIESDGIMTKSIAVVKTDNSKTSTNYVGGWSPIFFNEYSDSKMQEIILQIKQNRVLKLIISYDKNLTLATQINKTIQATTGFNPQFEHVVLIDDTAKYNHDQVVVTVYNKREN